MIKVIQSEDPTIKSKSIGYIRNMSQYKQLRILLVLCKINRTAIVRRQVKSASS
jgi:hypothetical protein